MEQKESPKESIKDQISQEPLGKPDFGAKITYFSHRLFSILKFILGACLLPFVYSGTTAFFSEISLIDKTLQNYFWAGVVSLVILYLFVYEPLPIYRKGQQLLELVFKFLFAPLVRVASYLLPVYTIIIFLVYLLAWRAVKPEGLLNNLIFVFGASIAFHLIFSAKLLRSKQEDFLKANYIFGFSLVYIINLMLLSLFFNCIFDEFSFVNFSSNTFRAGKEIFEAVFRQLFL